MTNTTHVIRMSFCVLGSGSAGNCSVLLLHRHNRKKPHVILIDCGLGLRDTRARLERMGLDFNHVKDVIVTHFDQDHFKPVWIKTAKQHNWRIRFHISHWGGANLAGVAQLNHEPFDAPFKLIPGCIVHPVHLAHDKEGTTGYRFDTAVGRLGFATDLGNIPKRLIKHFTDLSLLAIESNYCPDMQLQSDRPIFLKRRIMGGKGHLSNDESFEIVQKVEEQSPDLQNIVLLHLSRQCNTPGQIHQIYQHYPDLAKRLTITDQKQPISWINIDHPIKHHRAAAVAEVPQQTQHQLW